MPDRRAPAIYVEEVSTRNMSIAAVRTSTAAFVGGAEQGPIGVPVVVRSLSEFTATFGTVPGPLATALEHFFLNGGTDSVVLRVAKKDGVPARAVAATATVRTKQLPTTGRRSPSLSSATTSPVSSLDASCFTAEKGGIRALDSVAFNLLNIPPYRDGNVDVEVLGFAASYCVERRAMLIIDAPREWSDAYAAEKGVAAIRHALGTGARNSMVYFPHLRCGSGPDVQELPPGGAVAGVIARMDVQRGVWRSPAGMEAQIMGADDPAVPISDADLDRLNPVAVNCIRAVAGAGLVVWGARTMDGYESGGSEWKYIPVRRLALMIEESLARGLAWTAFEPNGEPLWSSIRLSASSFLDNLYRLGALQGGTPRDAYFVKCDRETTTQADIGLGVVNLMIGFAPLRPGEFIVLRIQLGTARQ